MTTPAFWGAAFLQGGGMGLYGDFLFADLNRYAYPDIHGTSQLRDL